MRTILIIVFALGLSFTSFSQAEPSKNLPPIEMLPKDGEVKYFYELPGEVPYKIFNQKGKLITSGTAKWIDYTEYEAGTYFIKFNGKTERFIRKSE